ncbi:MAG: DUF4173 domain-containing protein [Gemmatimonadota bacterium]|nr:DUF4173 domain-containing protein [Gemmatimonadota bacterium]
MLTAALARTTEIRRLWLATAIISGLGALTCFDAMPGLNWPLWTITAAGGFVAFQRAAGKTVTWDRLVPLILACVLSGAAAVTADPIFQGLILIGVTILGALSTLVASGTDTDRVDGKTIAFAPIVAGLNALSETGKRATEAAKLASAEQMMPLLRGGALALPIVGLFALLLSGADSTLASWRDGLANALGQFTFIPRMIFFSALGVLVLGAYGIAMRDEKRESVIAARTHAPALWLGATERLIVFAGVASVFGLFLVLQLSHLFGNVGAAVGSGVTYASAVHRGFAELTVCATLCALLIILADKVAVRGEHESKVRTLALVLIVETQLLLFSAYHRVDLYENAYGYTTERLYAQVYMGLVSGVLAMLAWEVWGAIDMPRLVRRTATVGVLALTTLSYWNHHAWIARQNVDRFAATGKIDTRYLAKDLAPNAMPQVAALLPRLSAADAAWTKGCLRDLYLAHGGLDRSGHWYEWNARRAAIRPALLEAGVIQPGDVAGSGPRGSKLCS